MHQRTTFHPVAGGDFSNVFEWIMKNGGIDTDADWPYQAKVTSCPRRQMKK